MPDTILDWPVEHPELSPLTIVDWSTATPWLGAVAEIVEWDDSQYDIVIIDGIPTVVEPGGVDVILTWQGPNGGTGPAGPQGPPGPAGGAPYIFTQSSASTFWHIVHGYAADPSVAVRRNDGVTIGAFGSVYSADGNTVDLYFGQPLAGVATLNF